MTSPEEEQPEPLVVDRDLAWKPEERKPSVDDTQPSRSEPIVNPTPAPVTPAAQPPPPPSYRQPQRYEPRHTSAATSVRPRTSASRTVRRTIRRVDPWSVLKLSFLFYISVMLVLLFASMLIFFAADAAGIVEKLENFVQGIGWPDWQIRPIQLFRALLLIGIGNVVIWTAVNVFASFLYNLVSDIVGGIQVTFSERES